jgi:methylmalonyl-CoA mutase C-terminal domain/subunit
MVDPGVAPRHHQMIDVAEERNESRTAPLGGLGELPNHRRSRGELPDQRQQRRGPGQLCALMRCTKRHESVYPTVASQALHEIACDQAAKTVADDVDAFVSSGRGQLFDGLTKPLGCARNVLGEQAVVVRGERLKPTTTQRAVHHGEDRVIVDDPVHQQDRCLGRLNAVMEESALLGTEASEIVVPAIHDGRGRREEAKRIHHQVGRGPACLNGQARCCPQQVQRHEACKPRGRNAPIGTGPHDEILPSSRFGVVESDVQSSPSPLRIVVAKPGLDGHDRGAKVVARALRDAGMEVIYTGLHQTPEQIVATAIAEDADAIGLSVLSGAHMTLFAKVKELLQAADADDIVLFGGGIIPEADRQALAEMGVAQVFTPGATMREIVSWVRSNVGTARGANAG